MNASKTTLTALFFSCFSMLAVAEELSKSKSMSVVTVSLQKVMMDSDTGKALQDRVKAEQVKLATPLQKKGEEIQVKQEKIIAKDKDVNFDKSALDFEKRELALEIQKIQAEGQKLEAQLYEMQQKEMTKFQTLVTDTIKDLAVENNWDLVVAEEQVLYAKPGISKTKDVIAKLDSKVKASNLAKKQALEKDSKTIAVKKDSASKSAVV